MLKQTIVWTALPHGSDGPAAAGTTLRLSAFVSPRLWTDDASVATLKLSDFPDFLDWPAAVGAATFEVTFDGGPTLPATVVATKPLRSDLWKALFRNDTLVVPFKFENLTGVDVISFPAAEIHDTIRGVYQRAATDPTYGGGVDLPPRDVLGADPDLDGIAIPIPPAKPYQPVPVDDAPAFVGTHGPEPGGGVTPGAGEPGGSGCTGCLAAPLALLRRLLKWLGLIPMLPFTMGVAGGGTFRRWAKAVSGPERLPDGGGEPAPAPSPMAFKKAAFDRLNAYVKPTSLVSEPLPTAADLGKSWDFHKMVATLGDYPNLLRFLGLVVDLEVTLGAAVPAAAGMMTVTPTLAMAMTTTHYTPRTHYDLGAGRFLARPRPASDLQDGLLRVDDTTRFRLLQLDVAGSGIKLQNTATTLVNQHRFNSWAGNEPDEQGLPSLQTAGLSIVRPAAGSGLKQRFLTAYALNKAMAAIDLSPTTPAAGVPEPPPTDELFAEDVVRGYRVDVFDDKSAAWHSLCRRIGTYTFAEGAITLNDGEDEGFVQASVTEPIRGAGTRTLRAHESLFTWNGWSLGAPRFGQTILPDSSVGDAANDPVTPFKLETDFRPKPKSLPRLRYGYSYRLRVRAVDLAGVSVFGPDDPAFAVTPAAVTPEVKYRRFEPVSPPMVMLQAKPVEGESLERLVVRSQFNPATIAGETARHIVPPKTSQLMAELHRRFDGTPAMTGSAAGYDLAAREAGALDKVSGVTKVDAQWLQPNDSFEIPYLPDPYARGVLLMGLPGMAAPDEIVEPGPQIVNKIPYQGAWPDPKPFRLRVTGIAAGVAPATPDWDAVARVLSVQVPQGKTYEVRISSWFNPTDLENMAVWGWTAETAVPQLNDLRKRAVAGRNWLHLPFRTLVLVHAVQQPLAIPQIDNIHSNRNLGDTRAALDGRFLIDGKSTEKVDLHASWKDPIDDLAKPVFNAATDFVAHKMQVAEVRASDPKSDQLDFNGVQHAVGDTKYHSVTYTPTASTRFREYFLPAITADPQNLVRPTMAEAPDTKTIDVLNTVRPDSPKLLYVVPLFEWERTAAGSKFAAFRRGGGLRVYMERPWYSSGDGELLGVTLRPLAVPIGSDKAELLKKYTSEWGMDPIWPAASTSPLSMADFVDPAATLHGVVLAEAAAKVDVVGYAPKFDPDRDLWYCDFFLDPATAYFPMVRLALVRFQPKSIDGAHISPVVPADFIQVVPHRHVKWDATSLDVDGKVKVEVVGPTYFYPQLELRGVSQMIVRLEQRSADAGDELGWEPIAAQLMRPVNLNPEKTLWQLTMEATLPRPKPMRVVVLEVERYRSDGREEPDVLEVLGGLDLPGLSPQALDTGSQALGYRVTFADAVEVP